MIKGIEVEPENNLVFRYEHYQNRHITITYTEGTVETDIDKVYYNNKNVYEIDFRGECAYLKFSPGKVLSDYHINYPVRTSKDDFEYALSFVWDAAVADGLILPDYTDNSVRIVRMDIAKDIHLDGEFKDYLPCIDTLVSPYKIKRTHDRTRYWHNNQNSVCIYDKKVQCDDHESIPDNTVRIEYKLDKPKTVKQKLGNQSITHLLNNWDMVQEIYADEIDKLFSPHVSVNQHIDEGSYFKSGKQPMKDYMQWMAFKGIMEDMTLAEFETFMKALGVDNSSYYRYRKNYIEISNTIPFGSAHTDKYAEIRTKLID